MFITLSSVQKIENISFTISVVVICLLFITLVSLFAIYFNYYKKCIDNELEDQNINKDVHLEHKSYFKNNDEFINNVHLSKRKKYDTFYSISSHAEKTKKMHSFFRAIFNVILFIFALVFIGIMATSIYVRSQGDLFYLGDTAYVVIQTGSMEEKNENNTYLFDNNLDDQIAPMSLIGVTPIESEDDLSQYDIVGYYNDNDQLIIHRIIAIDVGEDGETLYTLRGDSNLTSSTEERNLTIDQLVCKYNGYSNFGLGLTINYVRSNIGIITFTLAILLIIIYDLFDMALSKHIEARKVAIYPNIDYNTLNRIDEVHQKAVIPLVEVLDDLIDSRLIEQEEKRYTFKERLARADEALQSKYYILKNYLLMNGLRSRVSNSCDTYRKKRVKYVVLTIRGKSLIMHIKLDLLEVQREILHVKEDNKIKYSEVPIYFRIRSDLSLKRAKNLIDMMLRDNGLVKEESKIIEGDKLNEAEDSLEDISLSEEALELNENDVTAEDANDNIDNESLDNDSINDFENTIDEVSQDEETLNSNDESVNDSQEDTVESIEDESESETTNDDSSDQEETIVEPTDDESSNEEILTEADLNSESTNDVYEVSTDEQSEDKSTIDKSSNEENTDIESDDSNIRN